MAKTTSLVPKAKASPARLRRSQLAKDLPADQTPKQRRKQLSAIYESRRKAQRKRVTSAFAEHELVKQAKGPAERRKILNKLYRQEKKSPSKKKKKIKIKKESGSLDESEAGNSTDDDEDDAEEEAAWICLLG